ncbi:MAG: hypothetical protein IPJ82_06085 [Lewinellaceae bacterium]|nr:hypothetical protein [Lewinellaceae bacterium]
MSQQPVVIAKRPALKPAEDYYLLRREGIGFIEQMGSRFWTDYNLHDPGITILEALCYAISDLGYRLGWDIKDLLAPADPNQDTHQAFFTAREILTVNPWTTDDFRRLLIDLEGVRNAWLFCKDCACELHWYAWCDDDNQLVLDYKTPATQLRRRSNIAKVAPHGLYEVLLELEADAESGDLNDRKVEKTIMVDNDGDYVPVTIELRFPFWDLLDETRYRTFLDNQNTLDGVQVLYVTRTKSATSDVPNDILWSLRREVFYVTLEATINPGNQKILFEDVPMRFFCSDSARTTTLLGDIKAALSDHGSTGPVWQYRNKLRKIEKQVAEAKASLHAHRNLDEEYCSVQCVGVEDVAVCCDVEVAPDADIERVQAQIWLEIEQYFNPAVSFYSLQDLLDEGMPVEDIFQGPALDNGFIKQNELQAAGLKNELRVSDILNRLMDIEGVVAVNNLLLTKYDGEGFPIKGAADLHAPTPNLQKISAQWTLAVTPLHQPRLYYNLSRFLFYKNGLPFLPRTDEARDTLIQLRGETERPKIKDAINDLPVPQGQFRNPGDYYPVQYSLPLTYGIGIEGLPSGASAMRRARAKQLKAFLMPFEQILVNALTQVTHTADLFSLDPAVQRSYFTRLIDNSLIEGANDLFNNLAAARLSDLIESETQFFERRNRFLDHLLARFGEQFREYAMLLTNLQGQKVALEDLVNDKIAFLKAYPAISHDRARAFNHTFRHPRDYSNVPGLQRRVGKLLGQTELLFTWDIQKNNNTGQYTMNYVLQDELSLHVFSGVYPLAALPAGREEAEYLGTSKFELSRVIFSLMPQISAYSAIPAGAKFKIALKTPGGVVLLTYPRLFDTTIQAMDFARAKLTGLLSDEQRMILVEHLLLRPKFPGDALWPVCSNGPCGACGDEDPYSFRLTFVMPGWTAPYNTNLDMRRFAERVIRQETPAHLLPKICWIGNMGYKADPCDPVLIDLTDIFRRLPNFKPDDNCTCAITILDLFAQKFNAVYNSLKYNYLPPLVWETKLKAAFSTISFQGLTCLSVQLQPSDPMALEIHALMLGYFWGVARYGAQFSRFDAAWTAWLTADSAFDWAEERLHERVEALLATGLKPDAKKLTDTELCRCAGSVLESYGYEFHHWMSGKLSENQAVFSAADLGPIPVFQTLPACIDDRFTDAAKRISPCWCNSATKSTQRFLSACGCWYT